MNDIPFQKAATEWLKQIEMKKRLNKEARRAVLSFSIWLDKMIEQQEIREELENGEEN